MDTSVVPAEEQRRADYRWVIEPEVDYLLDIVQAVRKGDCSPECVFAHERDYVICACSCLGYYHGVMNNALVGTYDDPRFIAERQRIEVGVPE